MKSRTPIKKTSLKYATNLSSTDLYKYLPLLVEKGLVEKVPYVTGRYHKRDRRTPYLYVITEKGEALIRLYERIYDVLG